jgi:insulinase (Peptidase family M16)
VTFLKTRLRGLVVLGVGSWFFGVVCLTSSAYGQETNWPFESAPRPLAAREVKFPPYEIRTLTNGMQVVVVLHHEQPAVTMRLLIRAGAAQDPERKGGVAELVSHLLDQGTTTRSAEQIAEQIDTIGGAMGTGSGRSRRCRSATKTPTTSPPCSSIGSSMGSIRTGCPAAALPHRSAAFPRTICVSSTAATSYPTT